jgi:hypothetical protein
MKIIIFESITAACTGQLGQLQLNSDATSRCVYEQCNVLYDTDLAYPATVQSVIVAGSTVRPFQPDVTFMFQQQNASCTSVANQINVLHQNNMSFYTLAAFNAGCLTSIYR